MLRPPEGDDDPLDFLPKPKPKPITPEGDDSPLDCLPPAPVVVEKLECPAPTRAFQESDLTPYDPMGDVVRTKLILAHARRLLNVGPFPLHEPPVRPFQGIGVYALFYHGDFDLYQPLRSPGSTCPIYIGKADGRADALHDRIYYQHGGRSLTQTGLGPENFTARFLILPHTLLDIERALHDLFNPLWNVGHFGFGSRHHNLDNRRNGNERASLWDTLHPGRTGAGRNPRDLNAARAEVERLIPNCLRAWQQTMAALNPVDT